MAVDKGQNKKNNFLWESNIEWQVEDKSCQWFNSFWNKKKKKKRFSEVGIPYSNFKHFQHNYVLWVLVLSWLRVSALFGHNWDSLTAGKQFVSQFSHFIISFKCILLSGSRNHATVSCCHHWSIITEELWLIILLFWSCSGKPVHSFIEVFHGITLISVHSVNQTFTGQT